MFKAKIYAGIAVIVALGVLAMALIYRNVGTVGGYLATLDRVSVPFSIAALEMEKNTGEYATGVLRYVASPDPAVRAEALHDVDDFTRRHEVYMRLATNERERELGRRVGAGHASLVAAGEALMDERDRLDQAFEQAADRLEQIDVLIDAPMWSSSPGGEAGGALLAILQNIEAESAEVGFWLTLFKHRPTAANKRHLEEKVREQHDAVAALEQAPLEAAAERGRGAIHDLHRKVAADVRKVIAGESEIGRRAQALDELAERIDAIFDDEIQVMLIDDLAEPRQKTDAAVAGLQRLLRFAIPAYLVVALLIGALLIRAIIGPVKRLAAGTRALAGGDLDYRIAEGGSDEFGQLARQFNAMAARLQESTVSRASLEASERELRRTVASLHQEMAERQQAEREREQLQAQLQRGQTLAAMGQLVAGVAHEVRNPLFGISSTLDAMEASSESGRSNPRYLEVLRREVNRLSKLMTDLLEFARAPQGDTAVEPFSRAIAEALRSCRAAAASAGVALHDDLRADAPVRINHDRMIQVCVNLIENALQHAPRGSAVTVDTRLGADEAGARWIECRVADSGPGFAPDDLPHVFDPFFTRRRNGTGLGLAIVRRIVDEHHGSVEPANRPEGGAAVIVRLPVAKPTPD